jgi:hypothetical protein
MLILVLLIGNAAAQTRAKVDVSFEFVVKGTTLPAGHYNILGHNNETSRIDWRRSKTVWPTGAVNGLLEGDGVVGSPSSIKHTGLRALHPRRAFRV